MLTKTLAQFDPSVYTPFPRLTVTSLLTLAKALLDRIPSADSQAVELAAGRLSDAVKSAQEVMVERIRDNSRFTKDDVKFDNYVDGLWGLFRERMQGWSRHLAEGRLRLREDPALKLELEQIEARAERAAQLHDRLFSNGLEFLRRSYNEQAQLTANVLELIETEQLEPELLELTGDELLPMMKAAQRRYEAMVSERLGRTSTQTGDFNALKQNIQVAMYFYVNAVIGMLNEGKPITVEEVEAALQPIVNSRLGRRVNADIALEDDADALLDADALDPDAPSLASEPAASLEG